MKLRMKNLHFNNHISSKQSLQGFASKVLTEIFENKEGQFQISSDDGDGDVYKYTITVDCERIKSVRQITEN